MMYNPTPSLQFKIADNILGYATRDNMPFHLAAYVICGDHTPCLSNGEFISLSDAECEALAAVHPHALKDIKEFFQWH